MAYSVTPADVEARWRPLDVAESDVCATLLDSATVQLDAVRPRVAAAVAAGTVPVSLVVDALCEAVIRVLRNPDAVRNVTMSAEGGVGVFHGISDQAPRLRLTAGDLAALDAALRRAAPRALVASRRLVVVL